MSEDNLLKRFKKELHKDIMKGVMVCGCRYDGRGGFTYCRSDGRSIVRLQDLLGVDFTGEPPRSTGRDEHPLEKAGVYPAKPGNARSTGLTRRAILRGAGFGTAEVSGAW